MPDRTILIAGYPRSGSTWQFNAARLALAAAGKGSHAAWIEDHDRDHAAPVHLVKAHRPETVRFAPDVVLTTFRTFEDCLVSLARMNWLNADSRDDVLLRYDDLKRLYRHWAPLSRHETQFADIVDEPSMEVSRIAETIGLRLKAAECLAIADRLAQLQPPLTGAYDPVTLLHPRHRDLSHSTAPGGEPATPSGESSCDAINRMNIRTWVAGDAIL